MIRRNMVISLIGRPNVGKSSIFNRILKKSHKAITYDTPGVTRDRHYAIARFDDIGSLPETDAILVDTGGFYPEKVDFTANTQKQKEFNTFFSIMATQSEIAIKESDLVLFIVDVREGPMPFDKGIIDFIRKEKKEVWVIANKFDSEKQQGSELEFFNLGINENNLMTVSASHGLGITLLREKLHKRITEFNKKMQNQEEVGLTGGVTPQSSVVAGLAIIGAPNAGKSTLLNRLLGAERALVSDIAGTTVDPIEGYVDVFFGEDVRHLNHQQNDFTSSDEKKATLYEDYLKYVSEFGDEEEDDEEENDAQLIDYDFFNNGEVLDLTHETASTETEGEGGDEEGSVLEEQLFFESESEEVEAPLKTEETSFWRSVKIIDTAGIRRQKSVEDGIEALSVYRSLRAITESDVVLVVIDATKGLTHQDRRLCDIALEKGKSIIVVMNKMDLLRQQLKTPRMKKEWLADLRASVPWLDFCDIITISAKFGDAIRPLKESIARSIIVRHKVVSTGALNRTVKNLVDKNSIMLRGSNGRIFRVKYAAMVKSGPPTFLLFCNKAQEIPVTYTRYLKNGIRKEFKLKNAPIHLIFRASTQLGRARKEVERGGAEATN